MNIAVIGTGYVGLVAGGCFAESGNDVIGVDVDPDKIKELSNGKVGWRYDLAVREQRRQGTGAPPVDLWPAVRNITCPTLVVRGAETDTLSAEMAQQMEDTLAHGKLVQIPRAGHMVFEDNPEDFISEVTSFLQ